MNTGHVVLSTGQVSFSDITLAPHGIQRNVVLTTNQGAITIGPGSLSGTLVNLDLTAKQLDVNGRRARRRACRSWWRRRSRGCRWAE